MMNEFTAATDNAYMSHRTVQVPLLNRELSTEVSGDFSLPDYQPEIKRLLRIRAVALPPTGTADSGSMELSGTLDYFVLYMGHDNALYCAPLSTEYQLEIAPEDGRSMAAAGEPFLCICDATAEPPVGRVTAPRRLNIRCKLNAKAKVYGECPLDTAGDGMDSSSTEVLTDTTEVGRLYAGLGEPLPLQDDLILSPSESEWRVICAEGQVLMTEAVPANGAVNCRGEVTVKLTLCPAESPEIFADDAPPEPATMPLTVMQRKIPFSQSVELDGVTVACAATACGHCTDISVEMEEGHVHVDLNLITEVRAQKNELLSFVKDLYSTRQETNARYVTYPTERGARVLNSNVSLNDSVALADIGVEPGARVVDATAVATPEALQIDAERGRCILTGTCRAHLLTTREGEYGAAVMELPFRYEFEDPALLADTSGAEETAFDGSVRVVTCRGRMDDERAALDAELAISLRTARPAPLTAPTELTAGEDVLRRRGEYVICFPSPTDTLWSVAKRYHAPMAALTAANNLPTGVPADAAESLEGVGYLIV